jgi:hypothetical protein
MGPLEIMCHFDRILHPKEMFDHRDFDKAFKAKEAFRNVKSGDYDALKAWIAEYLDDLQIKRLRQRCVRQDPP